MQIVRQGNVMNVKSTIRNKPNTSKRAEFYAILEPVTPSMKNPKARRRARIAEGIRNIDQSMRNAGLI